MPEVKKVVLWGKDLETENEINIRNSTDSVINPATEEKQTDIVNGLSAVSANVNTVGDTIFAGRKRVVTPGTQLSLSTTQALSQGVVITALGSNVGNIYVGNSAVNRGSDVTKQVELLPGSGVGVSIDDITKVFIDADNGGDGVSYLGT